MSTRPETDERKLDDEGTLLERLRVVLSSLYSIDELKRLVSTVPEGSEVLESARHDTMANLFSDVVAGFHRRGRLQNLVDMVRETRSGRPQECLDLQMLVARLTPSKLLTGYLCACPDIPVLGRDHEIARLRGLLKKYRGRGAHPPRRVWITGPWGMGKRSLAREYAHRTKSSYDLQVCVRYVDLMSGGTTLDQYLPRPRADVTVRELLIVFDVQDPSRLRELLDPRPDLCVIATSTQPSGAGFQSLTLGPISPEFVAVLLELGSGAEGVALARRYSDAFGGNLLALHLLKWRRGRHTSIDQVSLEQVQRGTAVIGLKPGDIEAGDAIVRPILRELADQTPIAVLCLQVLVWLASTPVPWTWVWEIAGRLDVAQRGCDEVRRTLMEGSFLLADDGSDAVRLSPVLHAYLGRLWRDKHQVRMATLDYVAERVAREPVETTWSVLDPPLGPHLVALAEWVGDGAPGSHLRVALRAARVLALWDLLVDADALCTRLLRSTIPSEWRSHFLYFRGSVNLRKALRQARNQHPSPARADAAPAHPPSERTVLLHAALDDLTQALEVRSVGIFTRYLWLNQPLLRDRARTRYFRALCLVELGRSDEALKEMARAVSLARDAGCSAAEQEVFNKGQSQLIEFIDAQVTATPKVQPP